jgi:hypothetical protein
MKLLRNPVVTGVLVLIALGVVVYQVMQGSRGRGSSPVNAAGTLPAAAPAPVGSGSSAVAATAAGPTDPWFGAKHQPGIDRNLVGMQFHKWVAGAARDPFQLNRGATQKKVAIAAPSALAKWKLQAILLQTGSRMAAINGRIYREGDTVDGYRIVSIDEDTVWFQTPDSREHLGFQRRNPAPLPAPAPPTAGGEAKSSPPPAAEQEEGSRSRP